MRILIYSKFTDQFGSLEKETLTSPSGLAFQVFNRIVLPVNTVLSNFILSITRITSDNITENRIRSLLEGLL